MDGHLQESGLLEHHPDHDDPESPESLFIGAPIVENRDLVAKANPENYLHEDVCAMLIQHGRNDKIVPYQQSRDFSAKVMQLCGKERLEYEIIENADHGDPKFSTPENLEKVYSFIDDCFS